MRHAQPFALHDAATWWSVPGPQITSALADRPLVVLLHGLGADEHDLGGLVPALPREYLYASVRAPLPSVLGAGYQWFPPGATDAGTGNPTAVDAATRGLLTWIENTQARVRVPRPVALVGFSQGGAIAVQALRMAAEQLAGAAVLSGFVSSAAAAGDQALAQIRPRVYWGYDPMDPVIPREMTDELREFLRSHVLLTERTHPGAMHGITFTEAHEVGEFLREILR